TVRLDIYFEGNYGVNDSSNTLTVTGAWSASGPAPVNVGFNTPVLIWSQSQSFSKTYGATQAKSFAAEYSGLDVYGPSTKASVSASPAYTVAARPYEAPASVENLQVERVDDNQHVLQWENVSPGSDSAPYQGVKIWREDNVTLSRVLVATLGVVESW